MIRIAARIGVLAALCTLVGCAAPIAGTWKIAPDQKPGKVSIAVMTLAEDGTFTASAKYGDKSEVVSGCYKYANNQLMLCSDGQGRTYDAKVDGQALLVTNKDHTVKMTRFMHCTKGAEGKCDADGKCCAQGEACCKPGEAKPAEKK